jgi:hypothetical protein
VTAGPDPYGGEIVGDRSERQDLAARHMIEQGTHAASLAVRALGRWTHPSKAIEALHLTREFGGELGPGWLLKQGLTRPDLLIALWFSYEVVTATTAANAMTSARQD